MKILLVDDDVVTRKVLKRICEQIGCSVIEAENGEMAWNEWQKHRAKIVISDWVMPGMDGVELCKKIRAAQKDEYTFFFLVSDKKNDVEDFVCANESVADDFIYKPIDAFVLAKQLRLAAVMGLTEPKSELIGGRK
jgi:DNA-binding response OmpR family regulator